MKKIFTIMLALALISLSFVQAYSALNLAKGWNLVGFSDRLLHDLYDIDKQDNFIVGYWFDPIEKEYYRVLPINEEFTKHFNSYPLETRKQLSNTAFWIYTTKDADIHYGETIPLSETKLWKGWNLVSIIPEMADVNIEEFTDNCEVERIFIYHEKLGWVTLRPADDLESNQVGFGFAIKVKEDCLLGQQEVEVGAPPAIPE